MIGWMKGITDAPGAEVGSLTGEVTWVANSVLLALGLFFLSILQRHCATEDSALALASDFSPLYVRQWFSNEAGGNCG